MKQRPLSRDPLDLHVAAFKFKRNKVVDRFIKQNIFVCRLAFLKRMPATPLTLLMAHRVRE